MAIPVVGEPRWMAKSDGRKSAKLSRKPYYTVCK